MRIFVVFTLFLALGCTKKDIQAFKNYQKKNTCVTVSINADKQNSDDFFVVKTFDEYGIVRHLKTQIHNIYGSAILFDYDITYEDNKAIFKGSTKVYFWELDNPPSGEDPYTPPDPDAPKHPEEQVEYRDTRDFEVLFDKKTRFPVEVRYVESQESVLKLIYNHKGYLSQVGNYNVTTDNRGNILSILTPPLVEEEYYYGPQQLGVRYYYSDQNVAKTTNQYYETPNIFISPMYSILEILAWGPFQPDLERISVNLQHTYGEEYLPDPTMGMSYYNHQYDQQGNLVSYSFEGDIRRALPYPMGRDIRQLNRTIEWKCNQEKNYK